jgi:guanylate kinase
MDAMYIFISPPSVGELEKRLRSRGSETAESLEKRLLDARVELDLAARTKFDARIRNDDLHVAYAQLRELLRPQIEMCTDVLETTVAMATDPVCSSRCILPAV